MVQLNFFWFLLMQASLSGIGLVPVLMTLAGLTLPERRRLARLLILPALWTSPLVLAAVFYEGDVKSAGWLTHMIVPMLVTYVAAAIWGVVSLPGRRAFAFVSALLNAPFTLSTTLVVAMTASGTWL